MLQQCRGLPLHATQQNLNEDFDQPTQLKNNILLGHVSKSHFIFVETSYECPQILLQQSNFKLPNKFAGLDIKKDVTKNLPYLQAKSQLRI